MLSIRKTTYDDLDEVKNVFRYARKFMKENGNPTQWGDDKPEISLVEDDIENGNSYVVLDGDEIVGTFAFIIGIDPTYIEIDGKWLNDDEYGTIHRIASNGKCKNMFKTVLDYVQQFGVDIRIDTHKDNKPMLHQINKYGFTYCGIIIIADGTERLAFQKII